MVWTTIVTRIKLQISIIVVFIEHMLSTSHAIWRRQCLQLQLPSCFMHHCESHVVHTMKRTFPHFVSSHNHNTNYKKPDYNFRKW